MFNPCGHRVVIHRDPIERTTDSGIIIHSSTQSEKLEAANAQMGVVIAVGPDAWKAYRMVDDNGKERNGKRWAEPGDYVLFAKYAARNVIDPYTPDNEDICVMNDEDIICVITPETTVVPESTARNNAKGA